MHLETETANYRHSPEVRCWPTLRLVCPCAEGLASALSAGQSLVSSKQKRPTPNYPYRVWCWPVFRAVPCQFETKKANAQLPFPGVVLAYPVAGLLLRQEPTFHPTCQTDSYLTPKSITQEPPFVKSKATWGRDLKSAAHPLQVSERGGHADGKDGGIASSTV
jgi:hypothetical protein